jgi:predicted phage terminase large subunit-like protein
MDELLEQKAQLLGSLLLFTQVFYKLRTGREFELSHPVSRESHYLSICKSLKRVFNGECKRLMINVPPRYGKTELVINFIAWCLARYADSNFLYISYAHTLAKKQTQTIKQIIEMPHYRKLFGVEIAEDSSAKDNFETTQRGSVYAAGAGGAITGRGAGVKNASRFGGAIVIDDIHKPTEVTSDTVREGINDWYFNTLQSRVNGPTTPIIFIGQRLHEDDLAANLLNSGEWESVILPALDKAGNALHPQMHDKAALLKMEHDSPYVFASQYQQNPQPAGGGIFKPENFVLLDEEPNILATFITADTSETSKDYNDATVFSFWGLYRIIEFNVDINLYGLHWIDCDELRCEPKDLEAEFTQFLVDCCRHKVQPTLAVIEKKSTGVTLSSVLKAKRGLQIIDITRTKASGSKATRYLEAQPFQASRRISLPRNGKHTDMCIEHMRKITANDTHRFDDIADTFYDAVKIGLIDDFISKSFVKEVAQDSVVKQIAAAMRSTQQLREQAYG